METFTSDFNISLSQEMDSRMAMMRSQINRAINTAMAERLVPENQNMVSSLSSSGDRDTEASWSLRVKRRLRQTVGLKVKLRKRTQGLSVT